MQGRKKKAVPASGRKKETKLQALEKTGVHSLDAKQFGEFAIAVHSYSKQRNVTVNNNALKNLLRPDEHAKLGRTSFLGCCSAKVLHSATSDRWLNVILYHSPADSALLSFYHEFGPEKVATLIRKIREAAAEHDPWRGFRPGRSEVLARFQQQYRAVIQSEKMNPEYVLPSTGGLYRPLNLCPFASPNCRAVCLNTSGHGGIQDIKGGDPIWREYNKLKASRLKDGFTLEDDLQYLYLKGISARYGGVFSNALAARIRRTHIMWLIWSREGVIRNSYNDLIYAEALTFKQQADRFGVPMALRLNGTSDIPVETLQLTSGENMVAALGRKGIVCYDYTKDYHRMKRWLAAKNWRSPDSVVKTRKPLMRGGFPSNYYLCFSWSEVNGELSLKVLEKGGNVVMVFRRSYETGKKDPYGLPVQAGRAGALPQLIRVSSLSLNPQYRDWEATVVDGDRTDLRFDDSTGTLYKTRGGVVVGLIAKGKGGYGKQNYTSSERTKLWRAFTLPATLEKHKGKLAVVLRRNPERSTVKEGAIQSADEDLLRQATAVVDGYAITTTAMGT